MASEVNAMARRLQKRRQAIRPGPAEGAVRHQRSETIVMSFSVNTNTGAQVALQYLNATQGQLDKTQSAVNSGLKVASAKDDGAIYAIAQNQRGAVAGFQSVINSLNNGSSAIDVALSAGQSISDLLIQLKQKALSAADPSIDTASRQALNSNFVALRDQISTIVKNAVFNNFNLVDGSTTMVQALASADGTRRVTTMAQNLKLSGSIVTLKTTSTVSTLAKASAMITVIQASLTNVNSALAKLSSGAAKFSIQATFTQKLSDTLTAGIGNLVDANMAQESARLQSLQVKQQLGIQALSIANQAPQTILSLFK
jgi:flagellin